MRRLLIVGASVAAFAGAGLFACIGDTPVVPPAPADAGPPVEAAPPVDMGTPEARVIIIETGTPCTSPFSACGPACTNLQTDPQNCGTCGTMCDQATAMVCSQGQCLLDCAPGLSSCNGGCVDELNDPNNCGMCNKVCDLSMGLACTGGVCTETCVGGSKLCGTSCVDIQNDPNNCGGCAMPCDGDAGQFCVMGMCTTTCVGGTVACGSSCVNTSVDPNNCGGCGTPCAQGLLCSSGKCALTCEAGYTLCGAPGDGGAGDAGDAGDAASPGYCAALMTDVANCGMCGHLCPRGDVCVAGACSASVPPQVVSGALTGCSTAQSFSGRKVAIDGAGTIYAGMICSGTAAVAVSVDGGVTYAAPVTLPLTGITDLALQGGPPGTIYAGGLTSTGISFSVSVNGGSTWSTPVKLGSVSDGFGLSMAAFGNRVYVALETSPAGSISVFANATNGSGAFTTTAVAFAASIDPYDVLANPGTGDVWLTGDNGNLYTSKATDPTATAFSTPAEVSGPMDVDTDWTLGGGNIYVAGALNASLFIIPVTAPTTQTSVTLASGTPAPGARAVSADPLGNVYVVTQLSSGGTIALERLAKGATTVDPIRSLGTGAMWPVVQAGPGNTAVVVYTQGSSVYATTQAY